MSPSYRVSHEYVVEFPDPLAALAGEVVTLTDQISQWEGHTEWVWIWRRDARGKDIPRWPIWMAKGASAACVWTIPPAN